MTACPTPWRGLPRQVRVMTAGLRELRDSRCVRGRDLLCNECGIANREEQCVQRKSLGNRLDQAHRHPWSRGTVSCGHFARAFQAVTKRAPASPTHAQGASPAPAQVRLSRRQPLRTNNTSGIEVAEAGAEMESPQSACDTSPTNTNAARSSLSWARVHTPCRRLGRSGISG